MSWRDIKAAARSTLHEVMALPAVYRQPDGSWGFGFDFGYTFGTGPNVNCTARLVLKNNFIGDLDREGYGKVNVTVTRIYFDRSQFTVLPEKGGTVEFENEGTYYLDVPLQDDGVVQLGFEASQVIE